MENINKYIYELDKLNKYIHEKEEIVIYGIGDYGKKLVDYIFSIQEEKKIKGIIVTKKSESDSQYRGIKVYEAASFLEQIENCYVIIAVSLNYQNDIAKIVDYYSREHCYITKRVYIDIGKKLDKRPVVPFRGIDFLLAGFTKCGTTALYKVLKEIDSIYLSEEKESLFFWWCDNVEEPEKKLIENYLDNIRQGQVVGMIEPSFACYAEKIHMLFGDKVKLLFLVRNPVEATFSRFKMRNRQGRGELQKAYQKYGKFHIKMFEEDFEQCVNEGVYISQYFYWIEQFWKYYPKEQTKIILFEELIKEPNRVINDILKFIGVSVEYKGEKLPLANEGNFVMADEQGYLLAKRKQEQYRHIKREVLEKESSLKIHNSQCEFRKIKNEYDKAEKIYSVKMTEEQRRRLEAYFNDSVRSLEKVLNKDLSKLWF